MLLAGCRITVDLERGLVVEMSKYIEPQASQGRALLWVIVLLLAIGAGGVYFYLNPESLPKWASRTSIGQDLQTTTVYKWQDASGDWHISDQPPPAGTEYKVEGYTRDTNVLPLPPKLQQ